jgi:hypothetical protein
MTRRADIDKQRSLTTTVEILRRVQKIQDWLAAGALPRKACGLAITEFGISRVQANRYVGSALEMLRKDSDHEPLEAKRARYEAMLQDNIELAKSAKQTWVDRKGDVIEKSVPDLRAANQAIGLLMAMDGALPPKKV